MALTASMKVKEINDSIALLKKRKGHSGPAFSNYFWQLKNEASFSEMLKGEDSIVFSTMENGINRVYFYSYNEQECSALLSLLKGPVLVIDYLHNESKASNHFEGVMDGSGFNRHAIMIRLKTSEVPKFSKVSEIEYANSNDTDRIGELLNMHLDRYTGHFPSAGEIRSMINQQQVIVVRKVGLVKGFILFKLERNTCNLDQWYNDAENNPLDGMKMLINFYGQLDREKVKFVLAWVNIENEKVVNIYKKFGFKEDGIRDHIYIKK